MRMETECDGIRPGYMVEYDCGCIRIWGWPFNAIGMASCPDHVGYRVHQSVDLPFLGPDGRWRGLRYDE
jgi:hypothetical protein